jgi:ankyrin repeat protein
MDSEPPEEPSCTQDDTGANMDSKILMFFQYAADLWAHHYSKASDSCSKSLLDQTIFLLSPRGSKRGTIGNVLYNWSGRYLSSQGPTCGDGWIDFPIEGERDPLVLASSFGLTPVINALSTNESSSSARTLETACRWAAGMGHAEALSAIIRPNDSRNREMIDLNPAACAAAYHGQEGCLQVLLEHADASQIGKEDLRHRGLISLEKSVEYDFIETVRHLLWIGDLEYFPSKTLPCTTLCKDGTTIRKHREEMFRMILQKSRSSVACKDGAGRTVLSYVAQAGRYEMFQILLHTISASDRKTLANDRRDSAGRSPLWWAAAGFYPGGNYDEIVAALCREAEAAVQLDCIGPDGETVIAVAARRGHYQRVQILAAARPNLVDVPDELGKTPLSLAAGSGHGSKVAEILLSTGNVNVESTSEFGFTPFERAMLAGDAPLARTLVVHDGADIRRWLTVDVDGNLRTKQPPDWLDRKVLGALCDCVKECHVYLGNPGQMNPPTTSTNTNTEVTRADTPLYVAPEQTENGRHAETTI